MSETHDPHGKRVVNYISGENILNLTNMRGSRCRIPFTSKKKMNKAFECFSEAMSACLSLCKSNEFLSFISGL